MKRYFYIRQGYGLPQWSFAPLFNIITWHRDSMRWFRSLSTKAANIFCTVSEMFFSFISINHFNGTTNWLWCHSASFHARSNDYDWFSKKRQEICHFVWKQPSYSFTYTQIAQNWSGSRPFWFWGGALRQILGLVTLTKPKSAQNQMQISETDTRC